MWNCTIFFLQYLSALSNTTESCQTKVATLRKCFLTAPPQLIIRFGNILLDLAKGQLVNDLDSVLRDLLQSTDEGQFLNETEEVCLSHIIVHVHFSTVFLNVCIWVYLYFRCYGAATLVYLLFHNYPVS